MTEQAIQIKTSELKKVQFRKSDYLQKLENMSQEVKRALNQAVVMNNGEDDRVGLIFRSKRHGRLKVIAQVLMLGPDFIVLQGGNSLPIGSIERVII